MGRVTTWTLLVFLACLQTHLTFLPLAAAAAGLLGSNLVLFLWRCIFFLAIIVGIFLLLMFGWFRGPLFDSLFWLAVGRLEYSLEAMLAIRMSISSLAFL